jgi:hypothetical protein
LSAKLGARLPTSTPELFVVLDFELAETDVGFGLAIAFALPAAAVFRAVVAGRAARRCRPRGALRRVASSCFPGRHGRPG